ncbi:FAD-binding oxidoreductase [Leptolyngbya sp. FACHB-261]|uniref:NAD(P)/FAD-dependent oxidoreductase n=1 Tax=Leptolyngbya sp. FACHB-261 TaxID=2692806 RepID=UPI001688205C|nr:FAD-dependent oxidoreductase [Leptolyngbya sp. FACHB-261]MBD2101180.1 FAD-binding oxidoreductase [Leptolyngbya sp. FACHB-261]
MSQIVIVGCGVVGAMIAYELSRISGLAITVVDRQPPAQAATGAALGVLMGVISQKIKGRAWQMRLDSIQRYNTLIPELQKLTSREVPFNQQGILLLCDADENLDQWKTLANVRAAQDLQLEILDLEQVRASYPQICTDPFSAAIYSPQDRQVEPTALTLALVDAASRNGVAFEFGVEAEVIPASNSDGNNLHSVSQVQTNFGTLDCDWLIIAAGLGSTPLTTALAQPLEIKPVLGQALEVQLEQPLGLVQPVITAHDVHVVPVGQSNYWIGATVEFLGDAPEPIADATRLQAVMRQAVAFCPGLVKAEILRSWSGLRPRPEGRPAPVIGSLPGYSNVLLATGHYRNGVLLAPATAQAICSTIVQDY